jgi:probable phosphoglycerate mutase
MEIYIVRHGQTKWNIEKRLQGRSDIDLTQKGIDLAIESGETLRNTHFDCIYSSPLKRALETAKAFCGGRDIEIQTDDRLLELCFGDYEGHTNDELIARPGCAYKYFFDKPELYVPGPNGETLEELCERAADFMTSVVEPLARDGHTQRIMIVAHGAINKALMCHVKQHGIKDFWAGGLQRNCNVIILDYTDGKYQVLDESRIFYVPSNQKARRP